MGKKYNVMGYEEKVKIRKMYNAGISVAKIAEALGRHVATIYREINKGESAEKSQKNYEEALKNKGAVSKFDRDPRLKKYVEDKLLEGLSPAEIIKSIKDNKLEFAEKIGSVQTIYNCLRNRTVFRDEVFEKYKASKKAKDYIKIIDTSDYRAEISMPRYAYDDLKDIAENKKVTVNELIAGILTEYIKNNKQ